MRLRAFLACAVSLGTCFPGLSETVAAAPAPRPGASPPPASSTTPSTDPITEAAKPFATGCGRWYGLFNIPSAQYRNGRTYVVYPNPQQRPAAMCYDHAARKWSQPVLVSTEGLNRDSHGNPAMLVDAHGFLHVFWGCHLGAMRYARSEKPEDISTWVAQPPAAPHATYPQAMLTASGRIELFYRGGGHTDDWVLRSSDDGGRTWSAEAGILDDVRPSDAWYASSAQGPDQAAVAFVSSAEHGSSHDRTLA